MSSKSIESSSGVHKQLVAGLNIFRIASLTSEEDIVTAIAVLEGTLDEHSIAPIIDCSLQPEYPYVLEFMISSVNDDTSAYILAFVRNTFSSNVSIFSPSLGYKIVSRLSRSLSQLPYPSKGKPEGLDDRCHDTQTAPSTLEDLAKLLQPGFFEEGESSNRKATQKYKMSRSKDLTGVYAEVNDRLFRALGSQVPSTRDAVEETINSIVDKQKDTLVFFFTLLRSPEITALVRNACLRGTISQGEQVDDAATSPRTVTTHSPSIHRGVQIQADLYFPSPAEFGKWRILCSRAFLIQMTRDGAQSKAVLGRLQELSSGRFSETNQRRLTRDSPIDIYRARLPGGSRLVYFIDVVFEFGIESETQGSVTEHFLAQMSNRNACAVLRILGIYSMDKLNRTHWENVGGCRAKRGREYIAKCKERRPSGGSYYDPVTFNAAAMQAAIVSRSPDPQDQEVDGGDEIHRLLNLEQYSMLSQNVVRDILKGHENPHVFQVSPEEKKVVEFTKSSFVLGRSGSGKTTVIVFKMIGIERAWQNQGSIGPRPRQLFITKSQLLADKVEHDYVTLLFSLFEGPDTPQYVRERIRHWNSHRRKNILDSDGQEGVRDDLPDKFSQLQDSHFPLFVTVDTLWSLLENDIKPSTCRPSCPQRRNNKYLCRMCSPLVTFDVFRRVYWPHLPQYLTKGIAPALAFSEIIGIIKGSEKSLGFQNHALDRGAYESLSNGNYALFEAYQKLKRERGERDLADRTHDLLDGMNEKGLTGELVDFVYVDEVQDILLIDARLIISLCRNPDGFLWAGDTAQTISIGSNFSFKELGAFVYRYQRSIRSVRGTPSHPKGFQLLVNYRSHAGIVNCSNAIIQLLQRFPGAFDALRPESGVIGKGLPVFFHSECLPYQERDFFILSTGRPCMLGSKQCIIVRDEATRQELKRDIGSVGIILTLLNSKGLEYDDVILYNFFGKSVDANLWQHLTGATFRPLEDAKHAPLVYELKCLYVAITRARHRLWIVDYSDICLPIKRYLLNLGLVEEPSTSRNSLGEFVNQSTSEEWSEAGKRLLSHEEFEEAAMAFEKAGDSYMREVAMARHLREVARDTPEREAFVSAAGSFERCATMAAMAEDDEAERSHYVAASRCYAEVGCHREAVRALKRAKMYTEAASYCFDNNLLNVAVSLIKAFRVDQETSKRIKRVARISYLEAKNLEEAANLFDDDDELMEFVVQHELWIARAIILNKQKKYAEAVRQYLDEGQELDALEIVLEHMDDVMQDPDTLNAIIAKILWRYLSFGRRGWPADNIGIPASKISKLLEATSLQGLRTREQQKFDIFKLIFLGSMSKASRETLIDYILHSDPLDKAFKLLALDFYFDDVSLALDMPSQPGVLSSLRLFYEYSLLMKDAALDKAPWNSPWLCALFQIEERGEKVQLKPETFMYEHCMRGSSSTTKVQPKNPARLTKLPREVFCKSLKHLLWERLNTRISEKDRVSLSLSLFGPCLQPTLHGTCCSPHDETLFNQRVRFHLQHVMILNNLHAIGLTEAPKRIEGKRRLLGALEHALNPLSYFCGSISSLNKDLIPEAADGFATVHRWAIDALSNLDPSKEDLQGAFLTDLYKAIALARLRRDGRAVHNCLLRMQSARTIKHPRFIVNRPDCQIYTLRDFLAFMDGSGDLERGIKFFGYLVQERLPVDLAVLCTIVERLFGLSIMVARHRRVGGLHGGLLPRTWILVLWEDFTRYKDKRMAPLCYLAQATEKLLKDIYTGEYQRDSIRELWDDKLPDLKNKALNFSRDVSPKHVQDLCIARILRCLCLLGENFDTFQENIVQVASSLRKILPPESSDFHGRYINPQHWTQLAEALYQSTTSPFDNLVRLRLENSPISDPQIQGVDVIAFRSTKAIPDLLQSRPRDEAIPSSVSHEISGEPHVEISGQVADGIDGTDYLSSDQRVEKAIEYSADDAVEIGAGEGPDRSKEALVIQRAVRRYLAKGSSGDKLKSRRDRIFNACKASANAVHVRYRKFYLGPVPHLYLCVEWVISCAQDSKDSIKAQRKEARFQESLQELSDLSSQQTHISHILKQAHSLRKQLEPGSTLHRQVGLRDKWDAMRDLGPLRDVVEKVRDLIERLSDPKFPAVEFECAWNGIMPSKLRT